MFISNSARSVHPGIRQSTNELRGHAAHTLNWIEVKVASSLVILFKIFNKTYLSIKELDSQSQLLRQSAGLPAHDTFNTIHLSRI